MKRLILILAVLASLLPGFSWGADVLMSDLSNLQKRYEEKLEDLAQWCDDNELSDQAKTTRGWIADPPTNLICLYQIQEDASWPPLPENASLEVKQWSQNFIKLRCEQCNALIKQSRKFASSGRATFAFDLMMRALRENPQQKQIRAMLGFVEYQKKWAYSAEVKYLKKGMVNHPEFGWLAAKDVSRYEKGMRFYRNRWITKEQETQLRLANNDPWRLESPHYVILSYPSLEEGAALSRKLETLYLVWRQLFLRFFATEGQMQAFFSGKNANIPMPQHKVVFFRDREQYNNVMLAKTKNPFIKQTLGYYSSHADSQTGVEGIAYFFAGPDYDERTMNHEATHQLFFEARPVSFQPKRNFNIASAGRNGNFWIMEGIAMFMESLANKDGIHELGDPDDVRLFAARFRRLKNDFYVPLQKFSQLNAERFQQDPRVTTFYSQAAGLTWFLLFYDEGKYRDCLVTYLSMVYSGLDTPDTLPKLTQIPWEELDREYLEYIKTTVRPNDENLSLEPM